MAYILQLDVAEAVANIRTAAPLRKQATFFFCFAFSTEQRGLTLGSSGHDRCQISHLAVSRLAKQIRMRTRAPSACGRLADGLQIFFPVMPQTRSHLCSWSGLGGFHYNAAVRRWLFLRGMALVLVNQPESRTKSVLLGSGSVLPRLM